MRVSILGMNLKRTSWVALALLLGCEAVEVSTKVAVRIINSAPTVTSKSYSGNEGATVSVAIEAEDVDNNILTYTLVSAPTYGDLSGTPPNLTYTPKSYFYGTDSFEIKVSDGEFESNTATITLNIARQKHVFYLSPSGDNLTAAMDDATKPYQTFAAAYAAANAYSVGNANVLVHIEAAAGSYSGLTLSANWNSNVVVHGQGATLSNLGGVWGDVTGETASGSRIGAQGRSVVLKGWDIHLGNISVNGAPSSPTAVTGWSGGNGGTVTLDGVNLKVGAISSVGGGATSLTNAPKAGNGGSITLNEGVTSGEIYAMGGDGGPNSVGLGTQTGQGGTVVVSGTSGTILADGGSASTGTPGAGGTVTIHGTSGDVYARGAAAQSNSTMAGRAGGAGGTVTVNGTTGKVVVSGGKGGNTSFSNASGGGGGAGGTIVVNNGATVGALYTLGGGGGTGNGSGVQGNGGDGGTITINLPATYTTRDLSGGTGATDGDDGTETIVPAA